MTRLAIFTKREQKNFDLPPVLSQKDRLCYFVLLEEIMGIISNMRSDINKIGFMLQLGYFKASGKFFQPSEYKSQDVCYVAKLLSIDQSKINFEKYSTKTKIVHRDSILKIQGWHHFDNKEKNCLILEINHQVKNQLHPKQLMHLAINYLISNKLELPSYHCIADIITSAFNTFESQLVDLLNKRLTPQHKETLDELLEGKKDKESAMPLIKKINQSLRPAQIKENVKIFNLVKQYFVLFQPIISELHLSESATEYYFLWVNKASIKQLNGFSNRIKSYLHILAFIKYQYFIRHDFLVDIFIKSVNTAKTKAITKAKQENKKQKKERNKLILSLTKNRKNSKEIINSIEVVINSSSTETNKLKQINHLIEEHKNSKTDIEEKEVLELEEFASGGNNNYYLCLEEESVNLQRKISTVIQAISFDKETSQPDTSDPIMHYQAKEAKVNKTSPDSFLTESERNMVFKDDKFNISLYKALLFINTTNNIKSGRLNLNNSYRYLSIYNYMIDKKIWNNDKQKILKTYELNKHLEFDSVLGYLKPKLENLFTDVNNDYSSGKNEHLSFNNKGNVKIKTPPIDSDDSEFISNMLSEGSQIPIFDLLTEIDNVTNFTKNFKHHSTKNNKLKLNKETILAGVVGQGCNIGIPKMASISKGISLENLRNTVTWCFSLKNTQAATNNIVNFIHKLSLSKVFCNYQGDIHTSSDGQKINVGVDSLLASYSFKYFGKGKGVSIYTFIDDRQSLFYSTVISASEREAAYVVDGLLNNEVVKSSIHSTDTHGYTETIFGTTYLLDVGFAPRIKGIGKQSLYSFSSKKYYEEKGYEILPNNTINSKIIRENWDDILRFIATIKMKHVPASYLFKRLSSYAKHHKLYQALKEFGRIIKTIFILTYYNDVEFRQKMEKQLNRVELSNKFSKAVFFANDREFQVALKEEQELIVACKVLIQNAIILWNYLYLSQVIVNNKDETKRGEIIKIISKGSVLTWRHVNLHGEYDFSKPASNDRKFRIDKILSLYVT